MEFSFSILKIVYSAYEYPYTLLAIRSQDCTSLTHAIGVAPVYMVNKCPKFVAQLLFPTGSWDVPPNMKKPEV